MPSTRRFGKSVWLSVTTRRSLVTSGKGYRFVATISASAPPQLLLPRNPKAGLGERSWNGVAILARECDPVLTRSSLPGNPDDRQARYIEAAVNDVLITSIYLPNGNPQPGPKFDYKLARFEHLIEHGVELMKAGVPVVLAGDYNVVPIYPTRSLDNNPLIQPQSRHTYARLLAQGWTDALRKLQPEGPLWTFLDYESNRWALDKGMRLDHSFSLR